MAHLVFAHTQSYIKKYLTRLKISHYKVPELTDYTNTNNQVKSKKRVAHHGIILSNLLEINTNVNYKHKKVFLI